jgi:hypothetical protein
MKRIVLRLLRVDRAARFGSSARHGLPEELP